MLLRWCDVSKIVESRKNIKELKKLLSSFMSKSELSDLNDASELTSASLRISGCASGQESWRITMYRLLGLKNVKFTNESIEKNVEMLKNAGMKAYEEEGLKQIVLYEDMGQDSAFENKANDYDVYYDKYDLSKTINCSMQDNGKIEVTIEPGASYENAKAFRLY